jgi:predicted membrane-bound spermidine synthase
MRATISTKKVVESSKPSSTDTGLAGTRSLRRYLYFTAACTGAAIMIVEILGAKMLSPFMGASHFVWTAQIAVTLVALACGYYAGGRLVDSSQNPSWLYYAILTAAVYLSCTVLVCEPVSYWCLSFRLALGSLLASAILFFAPLALLAMTAPFAVRMITSSLLGVGGSVGRLTSVSTLGSLVGTLLIGYLLVPTLPNSVSMYLTAVALVLVSLGYFGFFHRRSIVPVVVGACLLALPGLGLKKTFHARYQWMTELARCNSNFGMLQVLERREDGCRFLLDDNLIQNTYDPKLKQSVSHFTYLLSGLARAYNTNIHDVLCIGLGAGIVPMDFVRQGAQVDVVEINPKVMPLSAKFFGVESNQFRLVLGDGRHYLNQCKKQYDAIVLDVFLGDSSPSHLLTREAFSSMRSVLRPGGVLVINSFGQLGEDRDYFAASLSRTLKAAFRSVRMHTSGRGEMFFAAADTPELRFLRSPDLGSVHPQVRKQAESAYYGVVEALPDHGRVLTDDYNPAEFFDASNREEYRRSMALAVKGM